MCTDTNINAEWWPCKDQKGAMLKTVPVPAWLTRRRCVSSLAQLQNAWLHSADRHDLVDGVWIILVTASRNVVYAPMRAGTRPITF